MSRRETYRCDTSLPRVIGIMRVLRSSAFWVILAACTLAVVANLSGENQINANAMMASERPSLSQMSKEETVLREGTPLTEVKGRFKKQGERFQFTEEGTNKSFKCLENLCLQRIAANQHDDDRKVIWIVSAKLTEFNSENFLVLEKAVRGR